MVRNADGEIETRLIEVRLRVMGEDCDCCGRAHYAGLMVCGSVWCCPLCAEKILAKRVQELHGAIETWHGRGGGLLFVTLTMRHKKGQRLKRLWGGVGEAWSAARGRYCRELERQVADLVGGWVRKVEVTVGRNGWHVHVHALLFVGGDVTDEHSRRLGELMFGEWSRRLVALGFEAPDRDHGGLDCKMLDVEQAREEIAAYVAKGTYESAALEVAGGMGKSGRRGNRTPFQVLADLLQHGLEDDRQLWVEWERASKGKRAMQWSQGFRAQLLPDEELSDEDAASETDHEGQLVALLDPRTWRAVMAAGREADLLAVVALSAVDDAYPRLFRWMRRWGLPPPLRA